MEVREYALNILEAQSLEEKLAKPSSTLADERPGPERRVERPVRPANLQIRSVAQAKVPDIGGMHDPKQRPRIVHAFANHELQAVELFAWALLAFPDTPRDFRDGLLRILREEQLHCRLYIDRLKALGNDLGDFPVSGYFWNKAVDIQTPAQFVCAMSLTFENANLDHTIDYAEAARGVGDLETMVLLERVHKDEIGHVRFGWHWLQRFKKAESSTSEAYLENIAWPLRPALAKGRVFHPGPRKSAGLDAEFVSLLEAANRQAGRDDGAPAEDLLEENP